MSAPASARRSINTRCPDSDLVELDAWAPKLLATLQTLPELRDVSSDQQSQGGALNLTIDRAAAGAVRHHAGRHRRGGLRAHRAGRGHAVFHPAEQLSRRGRGHARPPGLSGHLQFALYPVAVDGKVGAALALREIRPQRHQQPDRQPSGRVSPPSPCPSTSRRAWRSARRPRRSRMRAGALNAPRTLTGAFQGHGAGLPGFAVRRADPDLRRAYRGLCPSWACSMRASSIR